MEAVEQRLAEGSLAVTTTPGTHAPETWVILDADSRVIGIHQGHALAEKHAWRLWRDVNGLSAHLMCVQGDLAPRIRRGMKLGGVFPDVHVADPRRRHHAIAVYDAKTHHPVPSMTTSAITPSIS